MGEEWGVNIAATNADPEAQATDADPEVPTEGDIEDDTREDLALMHALDDQAAIMVQLD